MSLQLELLDNNSFSQTLENDFQQDEDISFEGRRRRLTRVSRRRPKGRVVYAKSGRRLKGRYVRK